VTQGEVPWARPGSGFTVLKDALVLTQANKRPVSAIAQLFGVPENRLWRAINAPTEAARAAFSHAEVAALGVNEQCVVRRFGFLTIFHDSAQRRVIGPVAGRKAGTFTAFREAFVTHLGLPEAIQCLSMDPPKAFQAGAGRAFPQTEICFDAFHLAKRVHAALDAVRRVEVKQETALKGARWGLLKSPNWHEAVSPHPR
jgi:transposase